MQKLENNFDSQTVTHVKKCCVCHVDISQKIATSKTCSAKCRQKLFKGTHKKRKGKCLFCGAKFEIKHSNKIYCDAKCCTANWRIKNTQKTHTIVKKYEILKKFGLIAGIKPPKGGRLKYELSGIKVDMYCTDLGGSIAKTPQQIAKTLELNEIVFFCKCLNINPYKFCSKIEIIENILLSENYSIIETCVADIWNIYNAPSPVANDKENILTYQEGQLAYQFFEAKEKKKLFEAIEKYRDFSLA